MRSRRALAEGTLLIPEHVVILHDHESDSIRPPATLFTDDARTIPNAVRSAVAPPQAKEPPPDNPLLAPSDSRQTQPPSYLPVHNFAPNCQLWDQARASPHNRSGPPSESWARQRWPPSRWEPRSASAPPGLASSPRYIDPSTLVDQGRRYPCPPHRHWTATPQSGPSHTNTPREVRSDSRRVPTHDLPPHDSWSQRNHVLPPHRRGSSTYNQQQPSFT